jgi:hypothetical protein
MALNPKLGFPVSTRTFSLLEMTARAWGSEWRAPDHRVYEWSNGRGYDSTDLGFTGIYGPVQEIHSKLKYTGIP